MITVKLPFKCDQDFSEYLFQWNKVLRFAFNRFSKEGFKKAPEVSKIVKERMKGVDLLDSSLKESAVMVAKQIHSENHLVIFGGRSSWKRFNKGLMAKEEWRSRRNRPLTFVGRSNKSEKGNRKFKLDLEENRVLFRPQRGQSFVLRLPDLRSGLGAKLKKLQALAEAGKAPVTYGLTETHILITYDEVLLSDFVSNAIANRLLAIDLNPNFIGLTITDCDQQEVSKVIHKEIISIKDLNDLEKSRGSSSLTNRRDHEVLEISKRISKLAYHHHCEAVVVEKLQMTTVDHGRGKRFNRLVNNQWNRSLFLSNLRKRCNILGIKTIEALPQYSSFIGCLRHPDDYDPIGAALELARRANLFSRFYLKKETENYDTKPGIVFPEFRPETLSDRWNERLGLDLGEQSSWKGLYKVLRDSKKSVRNLFRPDSFGIPGENFRLKSRKNLIRVFELPATAGTRL